MSRLHYCLFVHSLPLLFIPLLGAGLAACDHSVVPAHQSAPAGEAPAAYRPGELLIKFKPGVSPERMAEINRQLGVEPIAYNERLFLLHAKITGGRSVEAMVERSSAIPEIEYAEPNYLRQGLGRMP